jgi:NAD(P)H-flavin reductase
METATLSEFVDYKNPENLFALVDKDEDDQFPLKVIANEKLNHDTYKITLEFPNPNWISGLWAGGHFKMHVKVDGKTVTKPYTPISLINEKGKVVFVIKVYREHPDFPNGGKWSQNLENNVKVGDSIMCEGPIGKVRYFGNGSFYHLKKEIPHKKTKVALIAGGTGLTPMFSIAQAAVHSKDELDITFLYSNKTKDDILCLDEIEALNKLAPEQFKVHHTLTRHDDSKHGEWNGMTGRVTKEMLTQCGFPSPADDVLILSCGNAGFGECIKEVLKEMGYVEGVNFM